MSAFAIKVVVLWSKGAFLMINPSHNINKRHILIKKICLVFIMLSYTCVAHTSCASQQHGAATTNTETQWIHTQLVLKLRAQMLVFNNIITTAFLYVYF